jgi:hypothetical protein
MKPLKGRKKLVAKCHVEPGTIVLNEECSDAVPRAGPEFDAPRMNLRVQQVQLFLSDPRRFLNLTRLPTVSLRGRNAAGMSLADSLSCSPPQLLYCVGLTLQSASAELSYPEPVPRNGVSLASAIASFRAPPRRVDVPRLPLRPNSKSRLRPVRFAAPGLAPPLPGLCGADPRCVPVAGRRFGLP